MARYGKGWASYTEVYGCDWAVGTHAYPTRPMTQMMLERTAAFLRKML